MVHIFQISRSTKNLLILSFLFMALSFTGVSMIIMYVSGEEVFDITSYDAESNIIGFIPYADSGLDAIRINKYPQKELIVPYDDVDNHYDSTARVNFKIGEWKYLGCKKDKVKEITIDEDTKIMRSEFWFETDLISWTELDYVDVFTEPNTPIETQREVRWLKIKKQQGWGVDPISFNSWARITAWNTDLYDIYKVVGPNPVDSQLRPYVRAWPWEAKPYGCLIGLRELLKNPINYMPNHYNKYIRWNQLNFPGNPINLRDFALKRYNELNINGELFFNINMKESFWNRLSFPEIVEVKDNSTGAPIGKYTKARTILSVDNGLVLGPNDPLYNQSRTRMVDLQEIYDTNAHNTYSQNSAVGNMLATTGGNQHTEITTDAVENMELIKDPKKKKSEIPENVIGDGQTIQGIIDETAGWSWEDHHIDQGPNAQLPGTGALQPYIWESEEVPDKITVQDLYALKPLDTITKQDLYFNHQLKDRSFAVMKLPFQYGPHLEIKYANLQMSEIHLTMEMGLWGGYHKHYSITEIDNLTHVPYSANVRNIGICQTVRLKVIALSSYDYEPYSSNEPGEISPEFPLDDSEVEWPDEVDDGGDVSFSRWEEHPDFIDAFFGFIIEFFGSFLNFVLLLAIFFIGVGVYILKFFIGMIRGGGKGKRLQKQIKQLTEQSLELQKLQLQMNSSENKINYVQRAKPPKSIKYIVITNIAFGIFILGFTLIVLF